MTQTPKTNFIEITNEFGRKDFVNLAFAESVELFGEKRLQNLQSVAAQSKWRRPPKLRRSLIGSIRTQRAAANSRRREPETGAVQANGAAVTHPRRGLDDEVQ